jgi:hypothetical protein
MLRNKLFSVTAFDCEWQHFSVGGNGGAGKDTSNSGARCIHRPSGARGEGRTHRQHYLNRREAFRKMAESKAFQDWAYLRAAREMGEQSIAERVDVLMEDQFLIIEARDENGVWQREVK